MERQPASSAVPYGISDLHQNVERYARLRTPLAVIVFALVLGSAMLGLLGGTGQKARAFASDAAVLKIEYAPVLRSGNWFEMELTVAPRADVKDLVITVDDPLWEGMSIDTIAPDAESAEALDGTYSYHFGEVKAGERFRLKLDGQIQPRAFRRLRGDIAVLDDKRPLLTAPLAITVLP